MKDLKLPDIIISYPLAESVESWISHRSNPLFQNTRIDHVFIVRIQIETQNFFTINVYTSIEILVARVSVSFNQISYVIGVIFFKKFCRSLVTVGVSRIDSC